MLEKATKEDISNLQCYTIRKLEHESSFTGDDIETVQAHETCKNLLTAVRYILT